MTRIRTSIRAGLGLALATGLLVAGPTAAFAAGPTTYTDEFSFTAEVDDAVGCGVSALIESNGTAHITEFVDRDGDLDRVHLRVHETVTITSEHGQVTQEIRHADVVDLEAGTFTHHGVNIAKGDRGRIEIAAGSEVVDLATGSLVSFTGVDTFRDGDDSAACAVLNP